MANTSQRAGTPRSHAHVMRFLEGAAPQLVTELLGKLPPFFFVVGPPRCGTTALSKALGGHPRISFSKPKETHFLTQEHAGRSPAAEEPAQTGEAFQYGPGRGWIRGEARDEPG